LGKSWYPSRQVCNSNLVLIENYIGLKFKMLLLTGEFYLMRYAIFRVVVGWIYMIFPPIMIYHDLGQSQSTTLSCERSNDTCELKRIGLWWSETKHFSLRSLQGARIQVEKDGKEEKVIILIAEGNLPMTYLPNPSGSRAETLTKIKDFLDRPNQQHLQSHEENIFPVVCSSIFGIVAYLLYLIIGLLPVTIIVIAAANSSSADKSR
jgi:hypothetical protein